MAVIMNEDRIKQVRAEIECLKAHEAFLQSGAPTIDEMIKEALITALRRNKGNRTYAAEQLGVSLRTVRNWINKYQLEEHA